MRADSGRRDIRGQITDRARFERLPTVRVHREGERTSPREAGQTAGVSDVAGDVSAFVGRDEGVQPGWVVAPAPGGTARLTPGRPHHRKVDEKTKQNALAISGGKVEVTRDKAWKA